MNQEIWHFQHREAEKHCFYIFENAKFPNKKSQNLCLFQRRSEVQIVSNKCIK